MRPANSKPFAGSRMHVLDWVEGHDGDFVDSINLLLRPTGAVVEREGPWRPRGYVDPAEALLDRPSGALLSLEISLRLRAWWLFIDRPTSSDPNWDLAAAAVFPGGRRGLVLVEAKAHAGELDGEAGGKRLSQDASPNSLANHKRIADAIAEARDALGGAAAGVRISRDKCYQLSNRIAFAWKAAAEGIPTVLIYLGFTGDEVVGRLSKPIYDGAKWSELVSTHTADILPASMWEREIRTRGELTASVLGSETASAVSSERLPRPSDRRFVPWQEWKICSSYSASNP
jgi:hypothetical protein